MHAVSDEVSLYHIGRLSVESLLMSLFSFFQELSCNHMISTETLLSSLTSPNSVLQIACSPNNNFSY